jgi:dihydrofolate reductase
MRVTIVAALSENGVIGRGNTLPWHLPADLQRFKRLTSGHTVIMGRKTFESIGRKPLPGRPNIVVSRSSELAADGVVVVPDLPQALDLAQREEEVFVLGGAGIFAAALPLADRLELTRVHAIIPGDVFFPKFNPADWKLVQDEKHPADDQHAYPFSFLSYERRGRSSVKVKGSTSGN